MMAAIFPEFVPEDVTDFLKNDVEDPLYIPPEFTAQSASPLREGDIHVIVQLPASGKFLLSLLRTPPFLN